jgi:hypothetical protein
MHSDQRTALSRPLIRWRKNIWPWRDQPPASAGQADDYEFRIRNRRWIEVLVRLAREKEALRWVTQGGYEISVSGFHYGPIIVDEDGRMTRASQRVLPKVYLVPVADWLARGQSPGRQWSATQP